MAATHCCVDLYPQIPADERQNERKNGTKDRNFNNTTKFIQLDDMKWIGNT